MRIKSLAILAVGIPALLSAGAINFGSSTGTSSFNNGEFSGTLTLGSNDCTAALDDATGTCTLSGSGAQSGVTFNWQFTMPNFDTSPFSYDADPGSIFTFGEALSLLFSLSDTAGDSASGTFALSNLAPDGGNGVDIYGSISITSITSGAGIAAFDSLFGLPSTIPLYFTLDVDDCTDGSKAKACISSFRPEEPSSTGDPTAQFVSLYVTPGNGVSTTPEPGTFGMFGLASVPFLTLRRRFVKS